MFYYEEFDIFIDNFLFLLDIGNFESCSLVMIMIDSLKFIKLLWEMLLDFDKCLKDEWIMILGDSYLKFDGEFVVKRSKLN